MTGTIRLSQYLLNYLVAVVMMVVLFNISAALATTTYPRNFTWINPDDLSDGECKNDPSNLNSCCSCTSCLSTGTIAKKLELLTPYTAPLISSKEQFGSSLCVVADNSYALIGTEPLTSANKIKPVHLLWNLNQFGYQNGGYYFDPNHSTIGDVVQNIGYSFECYQEYIIIGNGYDTVQVFVKTQSPPWSLLKTIQRGDLLTDTQDYQYEQAQKFPMRAIFAETTKQLLLCDAFSQNLFVFSIYNLESPAKISYSEYETSQTRTNGGNIKYCHPNLYVSTGTGSVLAFEYLQLSKTWELKRQLMYDVPIGASVSCASRFLFASTITKDRYQKNIQNPDTSIVIFEKISQDWTLSQILYESVGSDGFASYSFGYSLDSFEYYISSIDRGIRLAVSDPFKPISASATGIVYVYEFNGTQFKLCTSLSDAPLSFKTNFGYSLALSNSHVLIGAPDNSQSSVGSGGGGGNIYAFNLAKTPCIGCDNVINSCSKNDVCGVCNGDNSTCAGCDGIPYSGLKLDSCGVCNGDDSTCVSIFPPNPVSLDINCNVTTHMRIFMVIPMFESMKGNRIGQNKIDIRMEVTNAPMCGSVFLSSFWEITANDLVSYRTGCTQNCLYFAIEISYTCSRSCPAIVSGGSRSSGFSDDFSISLQAYKASKPILFPRIVTLTAYYHGCRGCDEIFKVSPADATTLDRCLICGGNGQSCLDCTGLPFGDSFVDHCDRCVTEDTANKTCIYAQLLPEYDPIAVQCSQTLILNDFMQVSPVNSQRSLRWKVVSKYSPCGSLSVKYTGGTLTFVPSVSVDCSQQILLETSDTWKNSVTTPLDITVYGCDVVGCDMIKGSGKTYDKCGVCDGTNACVDCLGVPFGASRADLCGVCNGNNSTCDVRMEQIKNMLLQYEQIEMYQGNGNDPVPLWQLILFPVLALSIFLLIMLILCIVFLVFSRINRRKKLRYRIPSTQRIAY